MNQGMPFIVTALVILFLTSSCTAPTNHEPIITSLDAEPGKVIPSASYQIVCNATDPDGDELTYIWSTNGGSITGTGCEVVWTAPEQVGIYAITVLATDTYGGSDTKTLVTVVAQEEPIIIEDLLVTAEHCYLKAYSWGYKVGKGQEYYIECIVADTSIELVYDWFCNNGEITGEGSIIIWTAPHTSELVTVGVTVSDSDSRSASEYVILGVVSCSACSFPCE